MSLRPKAATRHQHGEESSDSEVGQRMYVLSCLCMDSVLPRFFMRVLNRMSGERHSGMHD